MLRRNCSNKGVGVLSGWIKYPQYSSAVIVAVPILTTLEKSFYEDARKAGGPGTECHPSWMFMLKPEGADARVDCTTRAVLVTWR